MSPTTQAVPVTRVNWHPAEITDTRAETGTAARITLQVDGWPGSLPGQHVDVRLTAPDGYTATRSYSLASSGDAASLVLAVDRLPGGEVSPYLVDDARVGDRFEVRGPLGGYFVWRPPLPGEEVRPVQLIAGGSGVVPLYSIVQAHAEEQDATPIRLLYSVRTPEDVFFADELDGASHGSAPFRLDLVYTRRAPEGSTRAPGRVTREILRAAVIPPEQNPVIYVCGSTRFVETVASWLLEDGHDRLSIRTERYGGT